MTKGLVSIIVPVYNSEKYLEQCISSIVSQSYTALEIILVDDGSSDNSPGMCDAWAEKDDRIKVIHKKNAGAGFARNSGLDIANGEYIWFVDSDDWIVSDAVEKAYSVARKESAQVVIFGYTNVDQIGKVLCKRVPRSHKNVYCGEEIISEILPELIDGNQKCSMITDLAFSLWACMFSGELIAGNVWRLVSEREYGSEDSYSLIMLYQYVSRVAILPEPLYCYREIAGSLSHTYKKDMHDRMTVFYYACAELSDRLGYPDKVRYRIAGLYLSQEIGIIKQLVLAKLPLRETYAQLKKILMDKTIVQALAQITWKYRSWGRNVLVWTMQKRLILAVLILVKAQTVKADIMKLLKGA